MRDTLKNRGFPNKMARSSAQEVDIIDLVKLAAATRQKKRVRTERLATHSKKEKEIVEKWLNDNYFQQCVKTGPEKPMLIAAVRKTGTEKAKNMF